MSESPNLYRGRVRIAPETAEEWKRVGVPSGVAEDIGRHLVKAALHVWEPGATIVITSDVRI
jgi:hypothetical protein